MADLSVRVATVDDAAACLAIYAPVVHESAISFELEPPSEAEMAARIAAALRDHVWLIAQHESDVAGYAYAGAFRARPAYRWATEVSVYIGDAHRGRGVGRTLYTSLLACLRLMGYHRAIGGMTLPNPSSAALHEAMGFRPCAVFPRVGFKFGAWHDVGFWELELGPGCAPNRTRQLDELRGTPEWIAVIGGRNSNDQLTRLPP